MVRLPEILLEFFEVDSAQLPHRAALRAAPGLAFAHGRRPRRWSSPTSRLLARREPAAKSSRSAVWQSSTS
jgi:hypothetical protein